jgi:hypothetical protein
MTRPSIVLMLASAAITVSVPAHAVDVTVVLNVHGRAIPSIEIRTESTSDPTRKPRTVATSTGSATIPLQSGTWIVRAHADGFWSRPEVVVVRNVPATIQLDLYAASTLTAKVSTMGRDVLPTEATVYVQTPPQSEEAATMSASIPCPIAANIMRCTIPAGKFDLAVRVPGFLSHYAWDLKAPEDRTTDLGHVRLQRGSSLSGSVRMPRGEPSAKGVTVTLRPMAAVEENDRLHERRRISHATSTVSHRGFFHFAARPGAYTVQATRGGDLISAEIEVSVADGRESVLREPLELARPLTARIQVMPPEDPWGDAWRVALTPVRDDAAASDRASFTSEGFATIDGLPPGRFDLTVIQRAGAIWHTERLALTADRLINVPIESVPVEGHVTLGDRPIRATLTFIGDGRNVRIKSRPDGTIKAVLPRPTGDRWETLQVESPGLTRSLPGLAVEPRPDGRPVPLIIRLPGSRLTGKVVDEAGNAAGPGVISVVLSDGELVQVTTVDGTFSADGLPPGGVMISAETRVGRTEQPTSATVTNEETTPPVTIVVKPSTTFEGVVRAPTGAASAAVWGAASAAPGLHPYIAPLPTSLDGAFTINLGARASEVTLSVSSPGFAYRLLRVPTRTAKPFVVQVSQQGGTLVVDCAKEREGKRPYVVHSGAILPAVTFGYLAGGRFSREEGRIRFEAAPVEEGPYSLCWFASDEASPAERGMIPPGRCTAAYLTPGARIVLRDTSTAR